MLPEMFNISLISKDNVGVYTKFEGSTWARCALKAGLTIYRVGKLIAMFCFITCKVLAEEWHDQHGWTYLNTADNVFYIKFPSGTWNVEYLTYF